MTEENFAGRVIGRSPVRGYPRLQDVSFDEFRQLFVGRAIQQVTLNDDGSITFYVGGEMVRILGCGRDGWGEDDEPAVTAEIEHIPVVPTQGPPT